MRVNWMLSTGLSSCPIQCSSIHLLRLIAEHGCACHFVRNFLDGWRAVVSALEICVQATRVEAHTKFDNHSVGSPAGIFSMIPLRSISSVSACMSFFTYTGHRWGAFTTGRAFSFSCSLPLLGNLPRPSNLSGNLALRSSKSLNSSPVVFCTTDTVTCCTDGLMDTRSRALLSVRPRIAGPWVSHTKKFISLQVSWGPLPWHFSDMVPWCLMMLPSYARSTENGLGLVCSLTCSRVHHLETACWQNVGFSSGVYLYS